MTNKIPCTLETLKQLEYAPFLIYEKERNKHSKNSGKTAVASLKYFNKSDDVLFHSIAYKVCSLHNPCSTTLFFSKTSFPCPRIPQLQIIQKAEYVFRETKIWYSKLPIKISYCTSTSLRLGLRSLPLGKE